MSSARKTAGGQTAPAQAESLSLTTKALLEVAILSDERYLARRPLPTAPDGCYDWEETPDAGMRPEGHSAVTRVISQIADLKREGVDVPDPRIVGAFIDDAIHNGAENDRAGAFSAGLTLLSQLPAGSATSKLLSDKAVSMLYNSLPHPPASLLGPVYSFRSADGGENNLQYPDLGRAGTMYARSVQGPGRSQIPPERLPDPEVVFECLLKRRKTSPHPGGNSSLTFGFASLVTHSLFRTDPKDWAQNNTSSYLDLSVLYGIDQATQDQVRDKEQGRGLLYPDTFSEERLILHPPAASALLVILSRNHNYIARNLLTINERSTWSDPPPSDPAARAKQDEEIFQTARLVNCGHFMGLIMGDYVAGFLGLGEGRAWNMNAFDPIKENGIEVERGRGNHCTVEFNILYRWHPTISVPDEKYIEGLFKRLFGDGKPLDQITMADFEKLMAEKGGDVYMGMGAKPPNQRVFGGMTRNADGTFPDSALADILQNATANAANTYGARSTPACMKLGEVMGILQARQWGVCGMNEFRKFLGLKEFASFEEWNPDPEIAGMARRLYGHINNLELYTGLQCEAIMPLSGGLRFACGYTMTRAVLGDAICLIRGDRFYTTAFTPANLTVWGYQDTMRDPNNGGFGGNLPKLLARNLPLHYPCNSVYTCFPFFTPEKMKQSLTRQGIASRYTFERPVPLREVKVLHTFKAIDSVFSAGDKFKVVYDFAGLDPKEGYGFLLGFNDALKHDQDLNLALHAIFPTKSTFNEYVSWYRQSIANKIKERSWTYGTDVTRNLQGRFVDIVNDVINVVTIEWVAGNLCGIPLKTKENPNGMFTEQEMISMFQTLYQLAFLNFDDPEHGFSLRYSAAQTLGVLSDLIEKSLAQVRPGGESALWSIVQFLLPLAAGSKPNYPILQRLAETGRPTNQLVAMVFGLAVGSSVNFAQAAVNVIDFYMDDAREQERNQIIQHVRQSRGVHSAEDDELLKGYVREAMRLKPQFTGLWREATAATTIVQGKYGNEKLPDVQVMPGDRVFSSFKNAHRNPTDFHNPDQVIPTRSKELYHVNGMRPGTKSLHACPGLDLAESVTTEIVKVVFGLPNVRRAPGKAGSLKGIRVPNEQTRTEAEMYLTLTGKMAFWPQSMHLAYDA